MVADGAGDGCGDGLVDGWKIGRWLHGWSTVMGMVGHGWMSDERLAVEFGRSKAHGPHMQMFKQRKHRFISHTSVTDTIISRGRERERKRQI